MFDNCSGATVCGYATDASGVMVEAVLVTKEVARKTFEVETKTFHKTKVSVAENVSGTVFKMRVNCLLPLAMRTIRLTILEPLLLKQSTLVSRVYTKSLNMKRYLRINSHVAAML